MLDSSCANACALNGLPGPMRHWFTGFTHSLTHPCHLMWRVRLQTEEAYVNYLESRRRMGDLPLSAKEKESRSPTRTAFRTGGQCQT